MTDITVSKSSSRGERGQSLVELAISLTVMLLLLSGAVSFGMALFSYVAVRDAAGEGALYGSIRPYNDVDLSGTYTAGDTLNDLAICARVKAASDRPVNMTGFSCSAGGYSGTGNNIDVTATNAGNFCEGTTGGNANGIKVQVDYNQPIIMPFIGTIVGGQSIHLKATVTDTILEPRCGP